VFWHVAVLCKDAGQWSIMVLMVDSSSELLTGFTGKAMGMFEAQAEL